MNNLNKDDRPYSDIMISDFSNPLFQTAFKKYFLELGHAIKDWNGLFKEMNDDGDNVAFVRTSMNDKVIGFIQFKPVKLPLHAFTKDMDTLKQSDVKRRIKMKYL